MSSATCNSLGASSRPRQGEFHSTCNLLGALLLTLLGSLRLHREKKTLKERWKRVKRDRAILMAFVKKENDKEKEKVQVKLKEIAGGGQWSREDKRRDLRQRRSVNQRRTHGGSGKGSDTGGSRGSGSSKA